MNAKKNDYDKIELLKGLDGVRRHVGMYLSGTGNDALMQALWEVIDNSKDEYLNGYGKRLFVKLWKDGSASVLDEGRGIPVSQHETENKSNLEVSLTQLHAGGKFNKEAYQYSGGTHGVGVSCTNATSDRFIVKVYRDGKEYSMAFEKGKVVEEISHTTSNHKTGTFIRFLPDYTIFKDATGFESEKIATRLKELAFLCSGLEINFCDEKTNINETSISHNGIADFVKYLYNGSLIADPIVFEENVNGIVVNVAFQWANDFSEEEINKCYTNTIYNSDGGTHATGFKASITRVLNSYIDQADLPKTLKVQLPGDPIREGLISVVSLRHPDPKYSSQIKSKLVSDDARVAVENVVSKNFMAYLEQNPNISKQIVNRCVNAWKAREAARKAREAVRKTVIDSGVGILPGKLADCTSKDPQESELFICEGASAGGCFSGDTKVLLSPNPANGGRISITFEELAKCNEIFYGLTIGNENECEKDCTRYCVKETILKNPRLTKTNAEVIRIVLENNTRFEIICTPDHLLMLPDGEYVEAKDSLGKKIKSFWSINPEVIKLEKLNERMDVYDLEVPETHNFALGNGIFVHNSMKGGRDRFFQAVLPLRGKILNVNKCEFQRMIKSEEIQNIITVLGVGIGKHIDISKLRYGKTLICVDADFDGAHIRTLLLTFFFRQMPQLIENGNIYVARPPLFKLTYRGVTHYLHDSVALEQFLKERKIDKKSVNIQRFKGLGEMNPEQLWETTMDPKTRIISKVSIDDVLEADSLFSVLMGDDVESRKTFICANSTYANFDV